MKLEMLNSFVLFKELDSTKTVGGIINPNSESSKTMRAEVLAVGKGEFQAGVFVDLKDIKVGDVVIVYRSSCDKIDVNGEERYIALANTILAKEL